MEKRIFKAKKQKGLDLSEIILIGVLLAAGAVLKFFVGSIINIGMKPNFIIAMYCLIIILIKPKLKDSIIIGVIAGILCQLFPGTPLINIFSEMFGAAAMVLLLKLPLKLKKFDFSPFVCTFISTLVSGFVFLGCMYIMFFLGTNVVPTALSVFLVIILGTALVNSFIVTILYYPLKTILKK